MSRRTTVLRGRELATLVLVAASLAGCAVPTAPLPNDYAAFVRTPRPERAGEGYRLAPPDEVMVSILGQAGVEEHHVTLGPDGRMLLPGLGEIHAAGRTCGELTALLSGRLIQQPDGDAAAVTVRVERYASQKVFVFGQVQTPGGQAYHGANNLLEMLANAEPTQRADVTRVQILRPGPTGALRRHLEVDLQRILRQGDSTLNVVLAEGDIVFVPPTAWGSVGLTLAQLWPAASTQSNNHVVEHTEPSPPLPALAVSQPASALTDIPDDSELVALRQVVEALTVELRAVQATASEFPLAEAADVSEQSVAGVDTAGSSFFVEPVVLTNRSAWLAPPAGSRQAEADQNEVKFWGP